MTHDEMIAVIQAHKEGKVIQFLDGNNEWQDTFDNDPSWNFFAGTFRVKPEPRTIWVNEYPYGENTYTDEQCAINAATDHALRVAVKYQEVIE